MLGIAASASEVYASTDSDVSEDEWRYAQSDASGYGDYDYLILYWGTAPNAFEGYCTVNSICYAIWPSCIGNSPLDLLRKLGAQTGAKQFWVNLDNGWWPGRVDDDGNWVDHINHKYGEEIPFP